MAMRAVQIVYYLRISFLLLLKKFIFSVLDRWKVGQDRVRLGDFLKIFLSQPVWHFLKKWDNFLSLRRSLLCLFYEINFSLCI